jgi:co-chaperonin GroES (HSP10)
MFMTLHPAPDRLVLELIEQRQESSQGIVMSNRSSGESPKGRVVEIGYDARSRLEGLQSGDTVFFAPGRGEIVAEAGESRIIVHLGDVLAWASSQ